MTIKLKIDRVNKRYADIIKDLNKKRDSEIKTIKNGLELCLRELYSYKYNKSKNIFKIASSCGCNDYVDKKSFYKIEVEDYDQVQTYTDSGYGDDDCFLLLHSLITYRVCPNCGKCTRVNSKVIESSPEWTRDRWNEDFPKGYIPVNWKPKIRVVK